MAIVKKAAVKTATQKATPSKEAKVIKATVKEGKSTDSKESSKKPITDKAAYDVGYIAQQLGSTPSIVRQKLRKAKAEREGRSYSWTTKAKVEEVIKTLKTIKLKNEE